MLKFSKTQFQMLCYMYKLRSNRTYIQILALFSYIDIVKIWVFPKFKHQKNPPRLLEFQKAMPQLHHCYFSGLAQTGGFVHCSFASLSSSFPHCSFLPSFPDWRQLELTVPPWVILPCLSIYGFTSGM